MLFTKKRWMGWEEYQDRIEAIDLFGFQQQTREESLRNLA